MSEVSVFGFSGTVDGFAVAISMSLILAFLSAAHHGLTMLDKAVNKTAFRGAIQSLYKELVLMGVTSFIITLLSSAGFQFSAWLVYLQIADVVLFLSTIFHVLFSVALIFANGRHMQGIREDLAKDMHQLVKQYREAVDSGLSPWTPFSALRRQVELRVLRITFLAKFNLSRSFDFGRYITIAEENNIIEMLELSVLNWMVFLGILIAVCVGFTLEQTDRYDSFLGSQCRSAQDFVQCKRAYYQCLMFTCGTGLMLMFTVGLAVASRVYTIRLIRQSGCELHELDKYILDDEMADLNDEKRDRISYKELKLAVERLKTSNKKRIQEKSDLWKKAGVVKTVLRFRDLRSSEGTATPDEPEEERRSGLQLWRKAGIVKTILNMKANNAVPPPETVQNSSTRRSSVSSAVTDLGFEYSLKKGNIIDMSSTKVTGQAVVLSEKHDLKRKQSQIYANRRTQLLLAGIKSGVFLFDSPKLYFFLRDTSLLLLCLLFSFFLVTFAETAFKTNDGVMWFCLPLINMSAALFFQVYTIKSSSLIFSFYKLDTEILGRVIEEKEEIENIEKLLREKLVNKLKNATNGESEEMEVATLQLFNEIQCLDGSNDGYISSSELRVLLQRLNIHFTAKRFEDAFSLINTSADGLISLMEFHAFIFPQAATEKKRMSRIQSVYTLTHGNEAQQQQELNKKASFAQRRRTGVRNTLRAEHSLNPSPASRGASFSRLLQQRTTAAAVDVTPDPRRNPPPITLERMRDVESGDHWGEDDIYIGAPKRSALLESKDSWYSDVGGILSDKSDLDFNLAQLEQDGTNSLSCDTTGSAEKYSLKSASELSSSLNVFSDPSAQARTGNTSDAMIVLGQCAAVAEIQQSSFDDPDVMML